MTFEFSIPLHVPSGNERCSNLPGFAGQRYRKFRSDCEFLLRNQMQLLRIPPARKDERRRVVFTRVLGRGQRAYDDDNLATGLKAARDSMTRIGMIADDRPALLDATYAQDGSDRRNGPAIRIELETEVA